MTTLPHRSTNQLSGMHHDHDSARGQPGHQSCLLSPTCDNTNTSTGLLRCSNAVISEYICMRAFHCSNCCITINNLNSSVAEPVILDYQGYTHMFCPERCPWIVTAHLTACVVPLYGPSPKEARCLCQFACHHLSLIAMYTTSGMGLSQYASHVEKPREPYREMAPSSR